MFQVISSPLVRTSFNMLALGGSGSPAGWWGVFPFWTCSTGAVKPTCTEILPHLIFALVAYFRNYVGVSAGEVCLII